jgi:hypothetical protein
MATSEHPFPNAIPSRHPLPSGFKLTPDARSTTLPVTPVIPPTVANGDVITSLHENLTVAALGDLWTNEQWLAAQSLSDPTSAKGDLLARDASALARLAVGTAGQVLTVDAAAPLGVKWAAPAGAVLSVFGRTGVVVATAGDYTAALVTNAVSILGSYADPAWITSLAYAKITGAPAAGVPASRQVIAGSGLAGGGALTADVTLTAPLMLASGASHRAGIVPDPGATVGATRYLREDATWAIPSGAGGGLTDPTTTLGDLIVRGAAAPTRLGVGTNGQALLADSAAPLGVKWGAVSGGGSQTPWTSDILAADFNLNRVKGIGIGALQDAAANFGVFISHASIFDAFKQINSSSTGWAGFSLQNDLGHSFAFRVYGSGRTPSDVAALESSIPMTFFTGAVERMRITAAGNVGIGTSNPGTYKLAVRVGTDQNLLFHTGVEVSSGVAIHATNDAVNLNIPLEIRASRTSFRVGPVDTAFSVGIGREPAFGAMLLVKVAPSVNFWLGQAGNVATLAAFTDAGVNSPLLMNLASDRSLWFGSPTGGRCVVQALNAAMSVYEPFEVQASEYIFTQLPSANPGAGTRQLWFDPADGNRVKFAA